MSMHRLALTATAMVLLAACEGDPASLAPQPELAPSFASSAALEQQLAGVRAATARYHDVAVALQDGFVPMSGCVAHPQLGAMGFHYARPDRVADADFDPAAPEMLLYVPRPDGSLRLVGVEYFIWKANWDAAGRTGRPTLITREFDFDPDGHMPARYTLHAWVWQANPAGIFAPFNPRVSCS